MGRDENDQRCICTVFTLAGHMDELIEASSLGTPAAKRLRESVPAEVGKAIVQRAAELRADGVVYIGPADSPAIPGHIPPGFEPVGVIHPAPPADEPPPECVYCARVATRRAGDAVLCMKCVDLLRADQPRALRRAAGYLGQRAVPLEEADRG